MRCFFTLVILCGITVVLGCSCDDVVKPHNGNGQVKPPAETPPDDGWLVSTNADGLELKVKAEKTGKASFKVHYILTNKGSKGVVLMLPSPPRYDMTITSCDAAFGQNADADLKDSKWLLPDGTAAKQLVIMLGEGVFHRYAEAPPEEYYKSLNVNQSLTGSVDVEFPLRSGNYTYFTDSNVGKGKEQVYDMVKSKDGLPCMLSFGYTHEKYRATAGARIFSKHMILKIEEE